MGVGVVRPILAAPGTREPSGEAVQPVLPIARVAEGDRILIDGASHTIDLMVDEATLEQRRADLKDFQPRYTSGFLAKYAALALGADRGAVPQA